ncbi:putative C2 domain-containing protein [Helianthus anomalus]
MMHRPPPDDFSLKEMKPHLGCGKITGDKLTSTYDLLEQMQYLYVRVVKARDLPAKDVTGSCDPIQSTMLEVAVKDKDLMKDDFMGWVLFDLVRGFIER